jgi:hypothetical protein
MASLSLIVDEESRQYAICCAQRNALQAAVNVVKEKVQTMNSGNDIFDKCWDNEEGFSLISFDGSKNHKDLLVQDAREILRDPLNAGEWFQISWYSQAWEMWIGLPDYCGGPNMQQAE